jgi:hypothetical protein
LVPERPPRLKAAHARHPGIHDHDVWALTAGQGQRFGAVGGEIDREVFLEHIAQRLGEVSIIFGD